MHLKKYAMLGVKALVSLFPQQFKNWLKKSPYLTSLYSRNLQRSGLFYGFPSRKKLEALYSKNMALQNQLIDSIQSQNNLVLNVLVVVPAKATGSLARTYRSIMALNNAQCRVTVFTQVEQIETCRTQLSEYVKNDQNLRFISGMEPKIEHDFLVVYAGNELHRSLATVLDVNRTENTDIIYFDTDAISQGKRHSPEFYPDWTPDLQYSTAYLRHVFWIAKGALLKQFSFSNDNEAIATFIANADARINLKISHVPLVMSHRFTTFDFSMEKYRLALQQALSAKANVLLSQNKRHLSLRWQHQEQPLVSLVIPTKNGLSLVKACIESILEKTSYPHYEILLVDNNSDEPQSIAYFDELAKHPQITLLKYPYEFNYSAINNFAVEHAKGSVVGLVNNDIEVISADWLTDMVGHVLRENIGCVGAKLLYSDGRIQHAGVVMGYGGGAGHAHKYFPQYHPGYMNRLSATGNFSAVTAACLLVSKSDYQAVGGLEETLKVAFNDVDFCLKVTRLGRRNLYCAEAELFHHESVSRGHEDTVEKRSRFESELAYLTEKWSQVIEHDPAYNPNLTLSRENFSIKDNVKEMR
ncbi:hypothetical protein GCM10009114_20320 [Aliiglaciecola litoralis]|uniref:Glycosyltransferase 2-like domain-containing protein n=1 Tax=Aliiglaciecola litoralis TaxID=582857 RepID=A0ABP3WYS7_9ALTE